MKRKALIVGCALAAVSAGCLAVALLLASPAASQNIPNGGGGDSDDYPWDTDNLRYGSYNAKSFNIPFHKYGGYSGVAACQKNVADGFFQTDNSVVNDFPRLVPSGRGDSARWSVAAGSSGNNAGCDTFVAQQNRLAAQVASGVGHVLDENGNLVVAPSGAAYTTGRSASDLSYGSWTAKAASGYTLVGSYGGTSDSRYLDRVDGHRLNGRSEPRSISPPTATWTVPSRESSTTGNFGASWHGSTQVVTAGYWHTPMISYQSSYCDGYTRRYTEDGRAYDTCNTRYYTAQRPGTPEWVPPVHSDVRVARYPSSARHLTKAKSVDLCPSLFHPRGEDSYERIGRSTGRSLTGLSHAVGRTADRFWCRSDLRYERRFAVEIHDLPSGIIAYAGAPASGTFTAHGRLGCYYTATAPKLIRNSARAYECGYRFPMPRCDSNRDGRADREYTAAEVQSLVSRGTIALGQRVSLADTARCDPPNPPPSQASFTADACVTADLEIYENRIAGSDAEPGVAASDRTLVVAAGRTAWDLDVTSPHPLTASPPRDTTAGSGDPDGCADGSEDRADHASSPADVARSQSPAPSYAASGRTDDAAPPNDADDDIDYTGAARNMAHRYASRVAENTCAAKRAEASLRLALLEAEEKLYKDWMERYEAWAKGKKDDFKVWRPTGYPSGTIDTAAGSHSTFYSYKHAVRSQSRLNYATGMSTMYKTRETDAGAVVSTSLTKPTVASNWCGDPAGFVKTYSTSVGNLKTAAENAIKAGGSPASPSGGPKADITKAPQGSSVPKAGTAAEYGLEKRTRNVPDPDCDSSDSSSGSEDSDSEDSGDSSEETCGTIKEEYWVRVLTKAEVKATVKHSYQSYILTVSGGGWSDNKTIAAATRTQTCSRWDTSSCPSAGTHPDHSYSDLVGTLPSTTDFPSTTGAPGKSVSSPALSKLLGKYYTSHADRADLKHSTAQTRNQAATNLGKLDKTESATITPTAFSNLAVPVSNPATDTEETAQRNAVERAAEKYQDEYTKAYDNAYDQATEDMGGKTTTVRRNGQTETVEVWSDFDWRYQTSTLTWGNYQEDPATTYSASTAMPRDGTGCDLIAVASDGSVSVEATRLDYETSSYGKGSVYSTRTDAQRTCKIRRTRTPELLMMYAPAAPPACTSQTPAGTVCGTDTTKTADSRLDTNTAKTNAEFYYVDYQPTVADGQPPAERFKLYDEAEVFAVKASLADRAPVLCYQPGEALVAHVGAKGVDAVNEAVFNNKNASGFAGGNKKHCYRHPSSAQLGSPPLPSPKPAFAFFDDTAHSAMASVSVVWHQPTPKIVSKLGSADDLKMMANTVNLVASSPVAYADATRTSSFYGTYYTFPADTSVNSPSGWDITGHPTLTLTSTFTQHQVQAKDAAAKTPSTHTMVFKFIDCVFGIEDVAFVDNIASPYALLSDENGAVPSGWKQTYDRDPHNSPTWYYPAFSTYEGARRLDGRRDSNGDPITYGRNKQGGFAHPSYDLENTAADGIGWGIVYEDKVGKQQPVWGIYAPPVPRDSSPIARQVCEANTLGAGGANHAATTGTPAARRIGTPATPPPTSGAWTWKTSAWNYQDNPIMLWSADDDPDRDDPWETKVSESSAYLPRKPHNNLEFATEDSNVAALDVFRDASNPAPSGYSRLEDQDMVLANFAMVTLSELESDTNPDNPGLRERAQKGGITCGYNWWYCFRPAPAGYRLWGKTWMAKRQLCIGFNFKLVRWSSTIEDALVSTLDNTDRNERGIPIRLRLGYIVGGIPTPGEPHPDSYYETSTFSTAC